MSKAAHPLAGAEDLDLGIVRRNDGADLPDAALAGALGEVHGQARVELQFRLDRLQHRGGLFEGIHDDQGVMLAAGEYAPDHEYLAHQGGLGITTRRRNGFVLAVRVVHQLG